MLWMLLSHEEEQKPIPIIQPVVNPATRSQPCSLYRDGDFVKCEVQWGTFLEKA